MLCTCAFRHAHKCNYLTNDSVKAAQHDKTTYSIMQVEYKCRYFGTWCEKRRDNWVLLFITKKEQQRHHLHRMIHHSDPKKLSNVPDMWPFIISKGRKKAFHFFFISIIMLCTEAGSGEWCLTYISIGKCQQWVDSENKCHYKQFI